MKVRIELTLEQEKEIINFEVDEPVVIPRTYSYFSIGGETYYITALNYISNNKLFLLKGKRL